MKQTIVVTISRPFWWTNVTCKTSGNFRTTYGCSQIKFVIILQDILCPCWCQV